MQHPQARFIPETLWHDPDLFESNLDERLIPLMQVHVDELACCLSQLSIKLNTINLQESAFLAIALSHPEIKFETLEELAKILKFTEKDFFKLLVLFGDLYLLRDFEKKKPHLKPSGLIADHDYLIYRLAAQHGHVEIMIHFEAMSKKSIEKMITAKDFYAYMFAAAGGHLQVLKHIERQSSDRNKRLMISEANFAPYGLAAQQGHLHVIKHLENKNPNLIERMIVANYFYAYIKASEQGDSEILKHLESKVTKSICNMMIKESNFSAYRKAAYNGHLGVLKHLEAKVPKFVDKMIRSLDFSAFSRAAINKHFSVCHHLLSKSLECFAYADSQYEQYSEIVDSFIDAKLQTFQEKPLMDLEEAQLCFYMLRHLIHINDRTDDKSIRFLLSILAVRVLAHREMTPGHPNELLQLARSVSNHSAIEALLNIPAVRNLDEKNDLSPVAPIGFARFNFFERDNINEVEQYRSAAIHSKLP